MPAGDLVSLSATASIWILLASLALVLVRTVRGPTGIDRIVAVDLFGLVVGTLLVVNSILTGDPVYLDAVIVMALIIFLGTTIFARYFERRALRD